MIDIEVDGEGHAYRVEEDLVRSKFLQSKGIQVWRYPAKRILDDPYDIFLSIKTRLEDFDK